MAFLSAHVSPENTQTDDLRRRQQSSELKTSALWLAAFHLLRALNVYC